MPRYVNTRHYNIKLSVDKIMILIEIIIITIIIDKNEKYKATFHLFPCLGGVFMVSQQCLVGPFFEAMHLKRKELDAVFAMFPSE